MATKNSEIISAMMAKYSRDLYDFGFTAEDILEALKGGVVVFEQLIVAGNGETHALVKKMDKFFEGLGFNVVHVPCDCSVCTAMRARVADGARHQDEGGGVV